MRYPRSIALLACAVGSAVVVPVASSAGATHKPKPVVKKVEVGDNYYSPTKLTIKKGNSVIWVWNNTNYGTHNVTLIKGPKGVKKDKFTSVDAARGLHFKRTFTMPGTYDFECTIHPSMDIAVTVKR